MTERSDAAAAFSTLSAVYDAKAWDQIADHFAEDCVFTNPFRTIHGREAVREFTSGWPDVDHNTVWEALDGDRIVRGWIERPPGVPDRPTYSGVSTWVYAGDGLFGSYEAYFDTVAFRDAWSTTESQ